ncbi:c-type cytochrome [Pseudochryseolinea flava]|uniref:Cytochrome C n=1 Tax=Pseudochryseolinea flava TaxID=2059302 RepID=A0A364XWS1_9BACT|nr:c-type cytochrome [Pseudochryseolinea flava]RAV98664.1 cytochrome C [Pseudochryseolinea flava]
MIKNFTSACKFFILVFVFAFVSSTSSAQEISTDPAAIKAGEGIFNANCKSCHKVKEKLVGPALAGVDERAPSIDWIKSFIKNPPGMIASGDAYANNLYKDYKPTMMTAFSSLKDEDIMNVLAYVKAKEAEVPKDDVIKDPVPGGENTEAGGSDLLNLVAIGVVIVLLLLVVTLALLISSLKRFLDQKNLNEEEKEVVHSPITLKSALSSPAFIFIVAFLVAALGFKTVINNLFAIGVQQGYAPKQPIAFSHKIHAGDLEIDCKYCHVGVTKGKSATIPSVNICMNCHNQIKEGAQTGASQIKQITDAYANNEPIKWVRIHNLPDLAYFNHAQHVVVGGVECQTCHGPIQEMEVVKQHSLLTMGWCIDCHRKTDIDTTRNAEYYDKMLKIHAEKKGSKAPFKVEDIGGLECSKCHY